MRRVFQRLTVVFAVAGLSAAQATAVGGVFEYEEPSEALLRCLSEDLPVAVKVDYPVSDCDGGSQSTFYLKVTQSGAEVSGRGDDRFEPVKLSPRKLSRAEGERILQALTRAMLRGETDLSCSGKSANYITIVEWACGAVETKRGIVEFRAPICSLHDGDGTDAMGSYARAIGVRDVAVKALRQAHR
ncbi:hypothetical protein [Comamonas sp. JC664]|uniref:hypothetical protein n=1 Tax=Comamonas sp. JC664 TaxID=2801917 RepID=UPI00174B2E45|nr:hypothetical protein [Comamonas sp. JC664]MBL0698182.1 hypothetical protein [Comamonas sp. JC664]GHG88816.1 hypothetical protein GCM10012319_47710 [Comamonas sp. KCTC 72670]